MKQAARDTSSPKNRKPPNPAPPPGGEMKGDETMSCNDCSDIDGTGYFCPPDCDCECHQQPVVLTYPEVKDARPDDDTNYPDWLL